MNEQEVEKLRASMVFLDGHIKVLELWMRRGDIDQRIVECVDLLKRQFEATQKLIPPKTT
jgi:hypothetical protein